ncbi:probable membrane-associated kinase regulator 2 [Rutidosis leptorrhynchoides]|uniref:probable membrane-associated kinase regulator 2 n=1 Tax=Rutidosis leptorrhynchoides TaxID=125765 RepID=UPI003A998881
MDVFSLLKFWKIAGGGDTATVRDFDSTINDDEDSFFDLVFTNIGDENEIDKKSSLTFSSPKMKIHTKTPQSPLRALILGSFQNNKSKLEKSETRSEIEDVKVGALLTRDNSLRRKFDLENKDQNMSSSKRFNKDVVNKYLNLMKPKVTKRGNEKSRLSEKSVTPSSSPASSVFSPRKEDKRGGGRVTVFKDVRKHLGKSRSASAILQTPVTKSDDSALEQQDSIKSAILHCKKSYNSPSQDCCVLSRSGSAPSNNEDLI